MPPSLQFSNLNEFIHLYIFVVYPRALVGQEAGTPWTGDQQYGQFGELLAQWLRCVFKSPVHQATTAWLLSKAFNLYLSTHMFTPMAISFAITNAINCHWSQPVCT